MQTIRRVLCVSLVALPLFVGGGACNKKERQVPPGPPPLPAMAGAGNAQKARDVHGGMGMHGGGQMPSDHPPILRSRSEEAAAGGPAPAMPAGHGAPSEAGAAPAAAAGDSISGTIRVADKLKDKAPGGATLFLIAKTASEAGIGVGPPVAVQRYAAGTWPLPFELTQANVMLEGTRLQGKVVISARVDQDGDAMTKQVGDLEGATKPITVPAKGIELILDTVRTQEAGAPSPPNMGGGMGGGMGGAMPPGHPALPPGHPK